MMNLLKEKTEICLNAIIPVSTSAYSEREGNLILEYSIKKYEQRKKLYEGQSNVLHMYKNQQTIRIIVNKEQK